MDVRLKHNSSVLVAGPTMSGKTTFVENLISNRYLLIDAPINHIHWFTGSSYSPPHSILKNTTIYRGLPQDGFNMIEPFDVVVFDDLMEEGKSSTNLTTLFTRTTHHLPCFVISISQNLFQSSKKVRTRSLMHNIWLFSKILAMLLKSVTLEDKCF